MAYRNIIIVGSPQAETLKKISKPVTEFDNGLHMLIDDLVETMNKAQGAGLSAVQVGILKRVFVTNTGELIEFVNPEIIAVSKKCQLRNEGCLSVPKMFGKVERPVWVKVKAQDRNGKWFEKKYSGYQAQAVCHEYDHLNGTIYTDIATDVKPV